jgi:thiol-disulfide isomerase/thioredoxin
MSFCLSAGLVKGNTEKIFFEGNFESAKALAGEEGKLFFVDFFAEWCTPCNWMDETVFNDKEVLQLLDSNYVSIKIDIDDLDGYEIKQKYNVRILPTMLIFNSEGQLIARVEETLSSRKMAHLLRFHNKEENKVRIRQAVNSSPKDMEMLAKAHREKGNALETALESSQEIAHKFRIQIGVYSDYRKTEAIVKELKSFFGMEVLVENTRRDGKTLYKVLLGAYENKEEALEFAEVLKKEHELDVFVK